MNWNSSISNFNPRSRVGNDPGYDHLYLYLEISIHVPAWGTTAPTVPISETVIISIHVPAWGTTAKYLFYTKIRKHFNPRSRVGNDNVSSVWF